MDKRFFLAALLSLPLCAQEMFNRQFVKNIAFTTDTLAFTVYIVTKAKHLENVDPKSAISKEKKYWGGSERSTTWNYSPLDSAWQRLHKPQVSTFSKFSVREDSDYYRFVFTTLDHGYVVDKLSGLEYSFEIDFSSVHAGKLFFDGPTIRSETEKEDSFACVAFNDSNFFNKAHIAISKANYPSFYNGRITGSIPGSLCGVALNNPYACDRSKNRVAILTKQDNFHRITIKDFFESSASKQIFFEGEHFSVLEHNVKKIGWLFGMNLLILANGNLMVLCPDALKVSSAEQKFKYSDRTPMVITDFAVDMINPSQFVIQTDQHEIFYCQFKKPQNVFIRLFAEQKFRGLSRSYLTCLNYIKNLSFTNGTVSFEHYDENYKKNEICYMTISRHSVERLSPHSYRDETAQEIKSLVQPDIEFEEPVIDPLEHSMQLREVYK